MEHKQANQLLYDNDRNSHLCGFWEVRVQRSGMNSWTWEGLGKAQTDGTLEREYTGEGLSFRSPRGSSSQRDPSHFALCTMSCVSSIRSDKDVTSWEDDCLFTPDRKPPPGQRIESTLVVNQWVHWGYLQECGWLTIAALLNIHPDMSVDNSGKLHSWSSLWDLPTAGPVGEDSLVTVTNHLTVEKNLMCLLHFQRFLWVLNFSCCDGWHGQLDRNWNYLGCTQAHL